MGQIAENIMGWLSREVPNAMSVAGESLMDETREEISTPYPPASLPFAPPHRRKGLLLEGLHIAREEGPIVLVDAFISTREFETNHQAVPEKLHDGTTKMDPRPYMDRLYVDVRSRYLDLLAEELRASLSK